MRCSACTLGMFEIQTSWLGPSVKLSGSVKDPQRRGLPGTMLTRGIMGLEFWSSLRAQTVPLLWHAFSLHKRDQCVC